MMILKLNKKKEEIYIEREWDIATISFDFGIGPKQLALSRFCCNEDRS